MLVSKMMKVMSYFKMIRIRLSIRKVLNWRSLNHLIMLSNRTLYSNGKRCRYRGYSKKGRKGKRRKKEKRGS